MKSQHLLAFWVIILTMIIQAITFSQSGEYLCPINALENFAPELYQDEYNDEAYAWVKKWGGDTLVVPYCTEDETRYFVVYRYRFDLSYWFGPSSFQWQGDATRKLITLKAKIVETHSLSPDDIRVFPVTIPPKTCLEQNWTDGNIVLHSDVKNYFERKNLFVQIEVEIKDADKLVQQELADQPKVSKPFNPEGTDGSKDQQVAQAKFTSAEELLKSLENSLDPESKGLLDGIRGEIGGKANAPDDGSGKGSKGKKGSGGFLPGSFSNWFVRTLEFLCKIFFPGLKDKIERLLLAAYLVAPDLFEKVGSFLGQLQDALTPDRLDRILDKATWVFQKGMQLYDYIEPVANVFKNLDKLEELSLKLKLSDISKYLSKLDTKLPIPARMKEILDNIPLNIQDAKDFLKQLESPEFRNQLRARIERVVTTTAVKYGAQEALKRSKIPILKDLNAEQLFSAIENDNLGGFVKDEAKKQFEKYIPEKYRRFAVLGDSLLDGNVKGAFKKGITTEIQYRTGLPEDEVATMYDKVVKKGQVTKKDVEELAKGAAAAGVRHVLIKRGVDPELIDNLTNGFKSDGVAGAISAYANMKGIRLSSTEIRSILNGDAQKAAIAKVQKVLDELDTRKFSGIPNFDEINRALIQSMDWYGTVSRSVPEKFGLVKEEYFHPQKAEQVTELLSSFDDLKLYFKNVDSCKKNLGDDLARAVLRHDVERGYQYLAGKIATSVGISAPGAVEHLKQGKVLQAFGCELQTRDPGHVVSVSQELRARARQRIGMMRELVEVWKTKFTPEELEQIMIKVRMVQQGQ